MTAKKWDARNQRDLIIEAWEMLDCESVGARELEEIQDTLRQKFGNGAVQSPASIARTLADEGAVLRHPEVFDCDLRWREQRLAANSLAEELDFSSFQKAIDSFARIEEQRRKTLTQKNDEDLNRMREIVLSAHQYTLMSARSKIVDLAQREQAKEISEWLRVWLQSPQLFPDWLDLRLRSPEFQRKFKSLDNAEDL